MERLNITKKDVEDLNLVSHTNSLVCNKDGIMYKILNPRKVDLDMARKRILLADKLNLYGIERPESELYLNGKFVGFTSKEEKGISLKNYLDTILEKSNLHTLEVIAYLFKDLETIIENANAEGIVMPDLGSDGNIMITEHGLKYIDYMGLQIKEERTDDISSLVTNDGWSNLFGCYKYFTNDYLYTSELDKASLIYLLFSHVFKIKLVNLNGLDHYETVKWICNSLNIYDEKLIYKVWALYQDKLPNEFIAEDLARIAEHYKMGDHPERLLVRK